MWTSEVGPAMETPFKEAGKAASAQHRPHALITAGHRRPRLSMNRNMVAVGIDLGTTSSVVAYADQTGWPCAVPDALGRVFVPSSLAVVENRLVVGNEAENVALTTPDRVSDAFKRDMGLPYCRRSFLGKRIPPEVYSALVLARLKQHAEAHLGPLDRGVITVPACFGELGRAATQEAGRLAGWDVLDIVNEATAAALACQWERIRGADGHTTPAGRMERLLVFRLGGGTFDVSLLEVERDVVRTLATDGNVRLGGNDFDERLTEHLAAEFLRRRGVNPLERPRDAAQLRLAVRQMKHMLSEREVAAVSVHSAGRRLQMQVRRDTFEAITAEFLKRMADTTCALLQADGVHETQIDRVVLAGGATRMPMVAQMLRQVVGATNIVAPLPNESVAYGAALHAAGLAGSSSWRCEVINVNSHSLGIVGMDEQSKRKMNSVLIRRNTQLPARAVKTFCTAREGQQGVEVPIVEGESQLAELCTPLGTYAVRGMPADLPKGTLVELTCIYESNGRLAVSARVPTAGWAASAVLKQDERIGNLALAQWEARLVGSAQDSHKGNGASSKTECPAQGTVPARLEERTQILRALDASFVAIGRMAHACEVPSSAAAAKQAALARLNAAATAKRSTAVREQNAPAGNGVSSGLQRIELTRARRAHQEAERRAHFALLVLGRECAIAGFSPEGAELALQRCRVLQRRLDDTPTLNEG